MSRIQEHAMKIVDIDATQPDRSPGTLDVSIGADTFASPGLRPEVLGDAAQRQTKAMIHAALFKATGEASRIGPYQVQRLLGEGGMGVVYAAYDDKLERTVALKLIRGAAMRRPDGRARTLREARALARVSHPNVVHVYQVGEVDDEIYVAMELLTGPTLRAWLAARPRAWREVLAVFRQAGEGLAAAHRQGVVHRDFKPANVIVGDDGRVRVLDFGLAHFGEDGEARALPPAGEITDVLLTQTGAVLGTPAYMAAEQFAGARGDTKTDQFSFCTALYEALYGQRPFVGDQLGTLAQAVQGGQVLPVKHRHDVPPWLHRVVVRGLQPDPATRWASLDALLLALNPPASQTRRGRLVATVAAASALLIGGVGYVYNRESTPPQAATPPETTADQRAEMLWSQDARVLVEARAALITDPLQTIWRLGVLGSDDPQIWQQARFLANAATARGLPAQLRRADWALASASPLTGGGLLARDVLGAVWRWEMSEKTGTKILPVDAATQLVVARDVPVWAAITSKAVQVFGPERAQTIQLGDTIYRDWRLASDGRTLTASTQTSPPTTPWISTVVLWDLTQPGTPPTSLALPPETFAVLADDASIVLVHDPKGIRVVRPHEGGEKLLKYRGMPWALSADRRFVVARPADRDGALDILEIKTGKSRRVEATEVTVLAADDVLFTRMDYGRPFVRRESLATGAVAWRLPLPSQAGSQASRLIVDPAHEQFAAAIGDAWGIGDLRRGELTTFVTLPKDSTLQWAGPGALMAVTDNEVRTYRPATFPVQLRHHGSGCGLSPGGRWAVVQPADVETGEYTRVELATHKTTTFRCPSPPRTEDRGGQFRSHNTSARIDDNGQIAMFGADGWSCWWDEQHGARTGDARLSGGLLAEMPRGVALAQGAEVELWSGPDHQAQRWTAAAPVVELLASPSGAALAVRSDRGVQVLHVDTGEVMAVKTWATPVGQAEVLASTMAWSPDSTRLAVLDKVLASLELSVWDVVGAPQEVLAPNYVTLSGHVLEDSPGRPRNRITFTPAGTAVAVTNRPESLLLVDLETHQTRQTAVPDLLNLRMRSETDAIGIDLRNTPYLIDLATREVSALAPDTEAGGNTRPPMVHDEHGSLWTCAALGPGTLTEITALDGSQPQELRARLLDLVAAM
ncbi:MAG: serine/threonine protein kinase [Nannocystis sp.]|uniref:serine/threonine-protein kinase n=1 Tax=Nannocystis sp. TaxID=1962667 RepID=UPI002422C7F8|nr:serine/threonine-protein kinase [Nannocystis sp.]MBK9751938.1 serine/threonine protein kinase [Nannocystis sp.]